MVKLHIK